MLSKLMLKPCYDIVNFEDIRTGN